MLQTLDESDDPSHVLKFEVAYISSETLLSPQVVTIEYYVPVGDVIDEQYCIETLYDALCTARLPVDVVNHEPTIGPRYTETKQGGEAIATVDGNPSASEVWPISQLRTTSVGAVQLTVRQHRDYDEHTRVFDHYDDELTQRTSKQSLSSIRLQDQESGVLLGLTTDGEYPSIAFPPEGMKPNHLSVC
ncbi:MULTISPECIES: hypothetical protein [unclassified Haloferax]|uniref:hypothetical protein n=1 Tax=unclassified Haloferax TaxID=2625095 RepID=UPI0028763BBB|nr:MULTISPECIES: hypothetical protein [unclassified Haloferax]MDS0243650.1 hypothetical protein [Haloferax sp. S2CR25]MDS0446771.1 hypothetical protein [Haloferax sp. S2CR25-2]